MSRSDGADRAGSFRSYETGWNRLGAMHSSPRPSPSPQVPMGNLTGHASILTWLTLYC